MPTGCVLPLVLLDQRRPEGEGEDEAVWEDVDSMNSHTCPLGSGPESTREGMKCYSWKEAILSRTQPPHTQPMRNSSEDEEIIVVNTADCGMGKRLPMTEGASSP